MNYKETFLFVSKCLTITHNKDNRHFIKEELESKNINWDNIVKISTNHYVFPALYCNLKRANFLYYLPKQLVSYMKHITELNRERNLQIIEQAKEINEILLENNITPVFLKGTGNLLEGLYEDIAERMVGDIDFIIEKRNADKTLDILAENEYLYSNKMKKQIGYIKHYPRMVKKGSINAIEVHLEMTLKKFSSIFNFQIIKSQLRGKDTFTLLSYEHQIIHTIINKQLNDYGYLYKNIALRNYYDIFLLSFKTNTLKSIDKFPTIFKQLNSFLAIASFIYPNTKSIRFEKNLKSSRYLNSALRLIKTSQKSQNRNNIIRLYIITNYRIKLIIKALYSKSHFYYVMHKLIDVKWYQRILTIDKN